MSVKHLVRVLPVVVSLAAFASTAAAAPVLGNPVSAVPTSDFCKVLKCKGTPATSMTLKSGEKLSVTAYRLQAVKNPTVVSIASGADGNGRLAVVSWYRGKTLEDFNIIPALTAFLTGAKVEVKAFESCLTSSTAATLAKRLTYKSFSAIITCKRDVVAPAKATASQALLYPKTTLAFTMEPPKAATTPSGK